MQTASFSLTPVYIYALVDPETGLIRYIGKSIRPKQRLTDHMREKSNCHRSHWLQSLKAKGLVPELVILERIIGAWPWQHSERYWIAYGKRNGWPLTNNTLGGDGVAGLPKETRERMRQTWIGRKHKPEVAEKLRTYQLGKKASPETRAKMSKAHKGRKITWADKLSDSQISLTHDQVEEIKSLIAGGVKVKDIAEKFSRHRTTISKIKKGKYYASNRRSVG